ncbi:17607_t:CDS:2 [Gigaspora margarita]|uniref:17607_t:CDS:1 n=1 Tax=Gigaspora margarita TaxID=4874 RepID=A0ABN7U3B1_GIGMA|nr:17607_t:CDS:2 [Gigaspora margarita]
MSLLYYDPISPLYHPYFDSFPRTSIFDWTTQILCGIYHHLQGTSPLSRSSIPISDQSQNYGSRIKVNSKTGDVVWRPATDIYDMNEAFIIHIDWPLNVSQLMKLQLLDALKRDNIEAKFQNDLLEIKVGYSFLNNK